MLAWPLIRGWILKKAPTDRSSDLYGLRNPHRARNLRSVRSSTMFSTFWSSTGVPDDRMIARSIRVKNRAWRGWIPAARHQVRKAPALTPDACPHRAKVVGSSLAWVPRTTTLAHRSAACRRIGIGPGDVLIALEHPVLGGTASLAHRGHPRAAPSPSPTAACSARS